jgi:hypothetical protein
MPSYTDRQGGVGGDTRQEMKTTMRRFGPKKYSWLATTNIFVRGMVRAKKLHFLSPGTIARMDGFTLLLREYLRQYPLAHGDIRD